MNLARAIINDMLRTRAGQNLTDTKPYSIEYLNASIEDVQEALANAGVTTQIADNFILSSITPVPTIDPGIQVYIDVNGYFNGVEVLAQPRLPRDMILPLLVWERQTGSGQQFQKVEPAADGLPSQRQGPYYGQYEWRQSKIWLVGSTETRDLRLRYEQALLPYAQDQDLSKAIIPIRGGKRALAFGVAEYYAGARGAPQETWAASKKKDHIDQLVNRQIRKDQRRVYRPRGYRDRGNSIDGSLGGSYR